MGPTLNIGAWSFTRVLGASVGWIVLALVLYATWTYLHVRRFESEGVGVAAVSVGLGQVVLVLFGPPVVLFVLWIALKVWTRVAV